MHIANTISKLGEDQDTDSMKGILSTRTTADLLFLLECQGHINSQKVSRVSLSLSLSLSLFTNEVQWNLKRSTISSRSAMSILGRCQVHRYPGILHLARYPTQQHQVLPGTIIIPQQQPAPTQTSPTMAAVKDRFIIIIIIDDMGHDDRNQSWE